MKTITLIFLLLAMLCLLVMLTSIVNLGRIYAGLFALSMLGAIVSMISIKQR